MSNGCRGELGISCGNSRGKQAAELLGTAQAASGALAEAGRKGRRESTRDRCGVAGRESPLSGGRITGRLSIPR